MTAPARRSLWHIIGWALVLLVVYLSLTPRPPPVGINLWDKASHAIAYCTLMFWFAQLHVQRLSVALWLLALGAGLEIAQGFTGYRQASGLDMLANTVGVVAGWSIAWRLPNPLKWIEARWP
jgi:VanZ family protein